jgi:DNA-binding LytR/AlgR family response regulator
MKAIQEKLPPSEFCRTHRSFIVSIAKVESVKGKTVKIANREIPIGGSYEQSVSSLFS